MPTTTQKQYGCCRKQTAFRNVQSCERNNVDGGKYTTREPLRHDNTALAGAKDLLRRLAAIDTIFKLGDHALRPRSTL